MVMDVGSVNSKNTFDSIQTTRASSTEDDFAKRLRLAAENGDAAELKQVCHEFESIFINMMYKQMKATVPKSDYLESDSATEIYNSMLDDQLVEISAQRGIGLADVMYKQLPKQYLKSSEPAEPAGGVIDAKK